MSKTEFELNEIGHTLDEDPRPILFVGPTEKFVKDMSDDRVSAMIRSTPALDRVHQKGRRDKTAEKWINGVRLGFAWAGSATELASHPAAKVIIDERDRMGDIAEGDVDSIVSEAVATYSGIIIRVSTPKLGDVVREWDEDLGRDYWKPAAKDDLSSPIWQLWQEASRHEWHIPCLDCGEYFAPHMDLLKWDDEKPLEEIRKTAFMVCPHCSAQQFNSQKEKQNSLGLFLDPTETIEPYREGATEAIVNGRPVRYGSYLDQGRAMLSFWVSGLCSPWRSYGQRATVLKKARDSGDDGRELAVVNTSFGQVFKPKGQAPEWQQLRELCVGYKRLEIPAGVQVITAGVDVHLRRLNYVIRGWGADLESWLLDYGELFGECKYLTDQTWMEIRQMLSDLYGPEIPIALALIDSGYKPNDDPAAASVIYQFCHQTPRAEPAKGHDRRTRAYSASNIEFNYKGKPVKSGTRLWHLDSDYFKSFIYDRYTWDPQQPGGWHFPEDVEDEYLRQVTAEAKIVLSNGITRWNKIRHANHYLDCDMMAVAAAHILRLNRLKEPDGPGQQQTRTRRRSRRVHRS